MSNNRFFILFLLQELDLLFKHTNVFKGNLRETIQQWPQAWEVSLKVRQRNRRRRYYRCTSGNVLSIKSPSLKKAVLKISLTRTCRISISTNTISNILTRQFISHSHFSTIRVKQQKQNNRNSYTYKIYLGNTLLYNAVLWRPKVLNNVKIWLAEPSSRIKNNDIVVEDLRIQGNPSTEGSLLLPVSNQAQQGNFCLS